MLKPKDEILFTRQRHEADVMGLHFDYRLVHGDKAYSWATKKEMPEPGQIIALFEQPIHDSHYALSPKVVIPSGNYGAGTTTLDWVRKATIGEGSTEDKLIIHTKDGSKYLLKKSPGKWGDKAWIFRNITGMGDSPNPYLEKIAARIHLYEHKATGKRKWIVEGHTIPEGFEKSSINFYRRKKK